MAIKVSGTEVISDDKRILNNEDLPDIRPSLLLDFANSKTLDPRITFTRGSTATYWDGHTTTKAEENLQGGSTLFNTTYWLFVQCTFTADYTTAPDGTSTAVRLIEDSSPNYHYLHGQTSNTVSTTSGTTYTWSIYAKKGVGTSAPDIVQLCFRGNTHSTAYANFNISTGAVTGSADVVSSSITSVGNGWYRLVVTATANTAGSGGGGVFSFTNNNPTQIRLPIYTGDTNADVLLWGPQFEQRSSATAYTATTTSPIVKYQPVLQTAASGEARFDHDPVTGESKGLLIEEARTNLVPHSTDPTATNMTSVRSASTDISAIAPDGTFTARKHTSDATSTGEHYFATTNASITSGSTYTASYYIKDCGVGYAYIKFYNAFPDTTITVDLSDKTVNTLTASTFSAIEVTDVGNDWYRISVTQTADATSSTQSILFGYTTSSTSGSFLGDGYKGAFIWGMQLEVGSFPTSYIPTSGSTVTRVRDETRVLAAHFAPLYNPTESTMFVDFSSTSPDTTYGRIWEVGSASTSTNRFTLFHVPRSSARHLTVEYRTNDVNEAALSPILATTVINNAKVAATWAQDDFAASANGNVVLTDTSGSVQSSIPRDVLGIGNDVFAASTANVHIKRLAYYPKRLPNATLQAMTEA